MVKNETRTMLERFVHTASKLDSWGFIGKLKDEGGPFRVSMHQEENGSWVIEDVGPNDADTRAFLTTFRKFVAHNDNVSLGLLGKTEKGKFDRALNDPDLSNAWKEAYQKLKAGLLHYLDQPYGVSVVDRDFSTRREVLDTFINGLVFHDDETKADLYAKWASYGEDFGLLVIAFNSIVYTIYTVIIQIAQISKQEIGI